MNTQAKTRQILQLEKEIAEEELKCEFWGMKSGSSLLRALKAELEKLKEELISHPNKT